MSALGTLEERYNDVKRRIADAAQRAGRNPREVMLVAVTKNAELDEIRELIRLGHQDFGESRAQQLAQRASIIAEMSARERALPSAAARRRIEEGVSGDDLPGGTRWHMIGHLQRNKVKKLFGLVRLIHSVDSLRLVEEIQTIAHRKDDVIDVLVQVNCSEEPQKFGCAVAAAAHLIDQIETMVHLRVRGLMTMAANTEDKDEVRHTFTRCHELFEDIRTSGDVEDHFNILSMGMTHDFETAVECGSNLVRVGTAIFGERPDNDPPHDPDDHDDSDD
jgi:hypothetical protein